MVDKKVGWPIPDQVQTHKTIYQVKVSPENAREGSLGEKVGQFEERRCFLYQRTWRCVGIGPAAVRYRIREGKIGGGKDGKNTRRSTERMGVTGTRRDILPIYRQTGLNWFGYSDSAQKGHVVRTTGRKG